MKKTLMQSIGRRLAALLLAMLMLVSIMPVGMAALEPGSTVSVKGEWIQGFYQDFRGSGLPGSFGTSWGQHERFTTNGQISYCVQKGAEHTNGNQSVSDVYASFSEEQQELIETALIYVYNGSTRYGYSADVETVASQAIVWAIQGGFLTANATTEKTFLDCSFSTKGGTSAANKANCIAAYSKIKEQILNHDIAPSFTNKQQSKAPIHTLKYNSSNGKYELTLTDTNNVLPYFTGSISGVTFTKNGNKLTISSNTPINGEVQVKLEKTISKYLPKLIYRDPLYLTSSNSQNKVTTALGIADPFAAYMKLETQALGQFTVNKVDQEGKALAGSGFTLYKDGAAVGAEKKGGTSYTWAGLVPGDYILKETTIPAGYRKGADVTFTVDANGLINGSPSASQNVSNTLITGQFTINKVDGTGKALAGSGFTLYKDGAAVGAEKKGSTTYTWTKLIPGTYTVKETTVPAGYRKGADITFTVDSDGKVNGSANASQNVTNTLIVGKYTINKVDQDGKPLSGSGFTLYKDGAAVGTEKTGNTSYTWDNLLPGIYTVKETTVPDGYKKGNDITFTVDSDGKVDGSDNAVRNVVNTLITGGITINKTDDKNNPLTGSGFTLFKANGEAVGAEKTGSTVYTWTELLPGDYTVKETTVPAGYRKGADVTFTVDADGKVNGETSYEVTVKNTLIVGKFTVNKVDDKGAPLSGSGFTLYRVNGTTETAVGAEQTGKTSYTWNNLLPGDYTVKETTVPAGYRKGADVSFTVDGSGNVNGSSNASATVVNTLIVGKFSINKVDETGKALSGSGFTLYQDGKAVGSEKTGATTYTWDNLLPGTYTIKETTVPAGYRKGADVTFIVAADGTVNGSTNASQNVTNTLIVGKFTINKVDQNGKPLTGSGFTLYQNGEPIGEEKTGATTYTWTDLLPGTYTVKETTVPAGYRKGADVTFIVAADGTVNDSANASQNVVNTLIVGKFTVNKVDQNGNALAGSGFTLYKDGMAIGGEKTGGTSYTWDNLLPGAYTVKETTVPSGAVKAEDITFIVTADGTVNGSANYSTNVVNIAQVGRIILSKTDAGTGLPLTGWIFEVRRVSDNVLMDTIISTNDSTVQSAELPLGDYYLVEKQAPHGYLLDLTYHIVNLTYGSPTERVVYASASVGDENAMGQIKIQKTGEVLTGVKVTPIQEAEDSYSISGVIPSEFNYHAKIKLLNADNAAVDTCTVDEKGAFVFTGVPAGTYTLILEYTENQTTKPQETTTAAPEETTTAAAETTVQGTTSAETQPETSVVTIEQFLSPAPQGKAEDVKTVSVSISVNADTVGSQTGSIGTITLQQEQKEPVDSDKMYTPIYNKRGIPGCVFNIIANENIKTPDGTLRYAKDTIVDTVTSGADGTVLSKELYLGKYRVEEIGVVPGFTINKTPVSVTLKYKDQVTPVVMETAAINNLRQKVQFGLYKESEVIELGETNADGITELLSTFQPSEGVVFTIHAAEDIKDVAGNVVIPKDGIVDIVTTGADGKTRTTKDLPLAAYYAKELYNSIEYVIDGTKYTVDVAETAQGDTNTETFILDFNNGETIINRLIRGQIQIIKKDAGTGEPLAGAQYLVTNADGVIVDKLTTGEDGTATTINLPYGIYTVTEIKPPEGYQLAGAQDIAQTADINADGAVIELNYKNKPTEVLLHKTDITSAEGLLGAQITIYNEAGEIVARGITDINGQFIIYNLPAGKYTFEETAAPIGYQLNTTVFQFEIDQNGNVTGDDTVTDRPTEVVIHKTDATNAAGLPGAEITVYDIDGNVVFSGITNENGSVTILNLPAGTYTFKETGAPAGYQINTTVFTFTIHEDGTVIGDNTITDKPTEVIFHKTDENGKPLANAEITVFDKDGNAVTSGLTDENGIFTVYGLPAGEYTFRETIAPAGYLLNDTVYSFIINSDGSVTEVETIINKPIPISDNPNTGDTAQTAGLLVVCIASGILMSGLLLMGKRKKKR